MGEQPTATYGLLGMLAVRPWTGYELTRQLRRSLRFVWPTSEGHLYREQKRLVALGWAELRKERAGRRERNHYTITPAGREALAAWLGSTPEEPHLQIEGVLRAFYADLGTPEDLRRSMTATREHATAMLAELRGFASEYLAEGGPMEMLEHGVGGPEDRREFAGRPMFPERLPSVAMALDVTVRLLEVVENWSGEAPAEDPASTRRRLERVAGGG